jgi:hypothetical protein
MAQEPSPEYEFVVYFYKKASYIEVYKANGDPVPRIELTTKEKGPLNNVSKLDTLHVVHTEKSNPGNTPCCVVWDGGKYCWC